MNDFFKVIFSMSLSGSLLIICFLLLKPLIKKHVNKLCLYYIWLVVIARLIVPLSPEVSLVGTLFSQIDNQSIPTISQEKIEPNNSTSYDHATPKDSAVSPNQPWKVPTPQTNLLKIAIDNLWIVWLAGAFFVLIRKITVYQSFVSYIKASRVSVDDINVLENFSTILGQCKIKQHVSLYSNSLISSPILIGFFRPCIILPTTDLSDTDFQNTILHELAHCKRLDMFYKWLVQITLCIHWFNPLVYIMRREINLACELSCDEAVLKQIDGRYVEYGDTLVNAITLNGSYKEACASVTLNENKEQLKERLEAIMQFKSKPKFAIFVAVLLIIGACLGATFVGAYNATEQSSAKPNITDTANIVSSSVTKNNDNVSSTASSPNTSSSNNSSSKINNNDNVISGSYISTRYYAKPYIIELMFPLSGQPNEVQKYNVNTSVSLSNSEEYNIAYKSSVEKFAGKTDFLNALEILLNNISQDSQHKSRLSSHNVIISAVDGPYTEDADLLTKRFYKENNPVNLSTIYTYASQETVKELKMKSYKDDKINCFVALYDALTYADKKVYADRAYNDNRINFFSILADDLTVADKKFFADKAFNQDRVSFFYILADDLTSADKSEFAKKAYSADRINFFSIVADSLTAIEKKDIAEKAYNDNKTNFFSILDDDLTVAVKSYLAEKAYNDNKINFFSILSDGLTSSDKTKLAEKAYNDDKINFFSIIADDITADAKKSIANKAYSDDKINFFVIIADELSKEDREILIAKARKDNKVNFSAVLD